MASLDAHDPPHPRATTSCRAAGWTITPPSRRCGGSDERDLRDLQVWHNLTWIHPLPFEKDRELASCGPRGGTTARTRSSGYSTSNASCWPRVIPRCTASSPSAAGRTDHDAVLPSRSCRCCRQAAGPRGDARRSCAECSIGTRSLPARSWWGDAALGAARPPPGMWPAEGSVCQAMIPPVGQSGPRLDRDGRGDSGASTEGLGGPRFGQGYVIHPEMLYRPWRVEEQGEHGK